MKSFLKSIALFTLPLIIIIGVYVISDPFDVFFYEPTLAEQDKFGADNDYHTTRDLKAFADVEKFNSFIIGNSRSTAFLPSHLEAIIPDSRFFNYGTPGESILNILGKLELIESLNLEIDNVLILIDDQVLKNPDNSFYDGQGMEYLHHPSTSTQTYLSYGYHGIKSYLQDFYFIRDLDYKLTGEYKPYMQGYLKDPNAENGVPEGYVFPKRDLAGTISEQKLVFSDIEKLGAIRDLLNRNNCNVTVLIPPTYDQIYFAPKNLKLLKFFFGDENVHDFSGVNNYSTPLENFYEQGHFTIEVADSLLLEMY